MYASQQKAAVKLSRESVALVKRIVRGPRNFEVVDCVHLNAFSSDCATAVCPNADVPFPLPAMWQDTNEPKSAEMVELVDRIQILAGKWLGIKYEAECPRVLEMQYILVQSSELVCA